MGKKEEAKIVYEKLRQELGDKEVEMAIEKARKDLERLVGMRVPWEDAVLHLATERLGKAKAEALVREGRLPILVVTMPTLPGYDIVKVIGPVYGLTVRSRGLGGQIAAAIETTFGGEITSYVEECKKARDESVMRLVENAMAMGANAVLKVDFETSDILNGIATIFSAYGTAVVVKPSAQQPPNQ